MSEAGSGSTEPRPASYTDRLSALVELTALYGSYAQFHDSGRATEFADLFARSAIFVTPAGTLSGRQDLMATVNAAAGRGIHHVITSVAIDTIDLAAESASGSAYVQVLKKQGDTTVQANAGRYLDSFVKEGGLWKFDKHRFEPFDS